MRLRKDGSLSGWIRIEDGDESTFTAERADEPDEPIPDPPSYRDKMAAQVVNVSMPSDL